jgi:hypothetical protein
VLPNIKFIFRYFLKMVRYEGENAHFVDQNPCAGIRADLKMCLLESDCVKKVRSFVNSRGMFIRVIITCLSNYGFCRGVQLTVEPALESATDS